MLKIGCYLQSTEVKNEVCYNKIIELVKKSDIDILIFPEGCYTPFVDDFNFDFFDESKYQQLNEDIISLSEELGKAVIVCYDNYKFLTKKERNVNKPEYGYFLSIFANAKATNNETKISKYIKTIDPGKYYNLKRKEFEPSFPIISYKNNKIGLTICYDVMFPIVSRQYGKQGVDIIINTTGGDVNYLKWYTSNKMRAIENECFTFCTMGCNEPFNKKKKSLTFGFDHNGLELESKLLEGSKLSTNDGIYVYDVDTKDRKNNLSLQDFDCVHFDLPKNYSIVIPGDIASFKKWKNTDVDINIVEIN